MVKHQLRHTIKIISPTIPPISLLTQSIKCGDAFHGTTPQAGGFSSARVPYTVGEGQWGQDAQGIVFSGIGNKTYSLTGGKDYGTGGVGFTATLGNLQTSYDLFTNESEEEVDFLIMGPGLGDRLLTQAKSESVDFNIWNLERTV